MGLGVGAAHSLGEGSLAKEHVGGLVPLGKGAAERQCQEGAEQTAIAA